MPRISSLRLGVLPSASKIAELAAPRHPISLHALRTSPVTEPGSETTRGRESSGKALCRT